MELVADELGLLGTEAAPVGVTLLVGSCGLSTFKRPEEGGGGPLGDGPLLELLAKELLAPTVGRDPPPMGTVGLGAVGVPTLLKLCDGLIYAGTTPWPD